MMLYMLNNENKDSDFDSLLVIVVAAFVIMARALRV